MGGALARIRQNARTSRKDALVSSQFRRAHYLKRLRTLLSETATEDLLLSMWHLRQLQSGRSEKNLFFKSLPRDAITTDIGASLYLHPWTLETLANLKIMNPYASKMGRERKLDVRHFDAVSKVYNLLHELENASDGIALRKRSVLLEMYRLTKRQFEWQRGLTTPNRIYRYARLYVTENSEQFFAQKYGIELQIFLKFCFAAYAHLVSTPLMSKKTNFTEIGISDEQRDRAIQVISLSLPEARTVAVRDRDGFDHVGYAPSVLRSHPCLDLGQVLIAPLVELLFNRFTEHLFYDFAGVGEFRAEFGKNFEFYVEEIFSEHADDFEVKTEMVYGKTQLRTPDLFLKQGQSVSVALELKSRKLSINAKYGGDPVSDAEGSFDEIANGIFQLWKYAQDSSRQLVPSDVCASSTTRLVLLTLDDWLGMSKPVVDEVLVRAHSLADNKGIQKGTAIRRYVHFCTIDDVEQILNKGDIGDFVKVLDFALDARFKGWSLTSVRNELIGRAGLPEKEPLNSFVKISKTLPWWGEFESETHNS